jgi:drug/metabolite transporter (DMT)-like permease
VANVAWFNLLRRRTAAMAAAPVFLVPVFAIGFGALVLNEAIGPSLALGGLTILAGIAMVTHSAWRR